MKLTVDGAKRIMEKAYPDSFVTSIMDSPKGYICSLKPKNWNPNEMLMGNFFKVSKSDCKISEYSPVMDPEEFKLAMKNTVYLREKDE